MCFCRSLSWGILMYNWGCIFQHCFHILVISWSATFNELFQCTEWLDSITVQLYSNTQLPFWFGNGASVLNLVFVSLKINRQAKILWYSFLVDRSYYGDQKTMNFNHHQSNLLDLQCTKRDLDFMIGGMFVKLFSEGTSAAMIRAFIISI